MAPPQKMVIVGAGPVGSLAALYAARRGYQVEVYELRPDLRDPRIVPLNFTKSINLALSERGINAIRHADLPDLLQDILGACVPMRGRMIHGKKPSGALYEVPQDFDVHGRCNLAMDRGALNARLLDALEDLPNVELFFNHKLTGADFRKRKAWIENRDRLSPSGRPREMEIDFDIMLGADGAHSAVRYHMMKFSRMDYQQEYIDTLWCEFRIEPGKARTDGSETWKISPNHLHIWPGKDFMFIAIPSEDGSFTCTLFLPANYFAELEADPSQVPSFFDVHFPGVRDHISDASLVEAFNTNPHLPLISLKCKPYHFGSSGVIIGDAAHAMVPFYGQGMNTGMEDVRILFSILDKHAAQLAETNNPLVGDSASDSDEDEEVSAAAAASEQAHAQALAEYSATRWVDAYTINDLAFQNYVEMRTSQSVAYKLRKSFEEFLSYRLPWLGWQTKYSLVVFSNRPYSECVRRTDRQGRVLGRLLAGLATSPFLAAGIFVAYSYRRPLKELWHNAVAIWQMM